MQKNLVNNVLRIDLSNKSQSEIIECLQSVLAAKYILYKKGFKVNIQTKNKPIKAKASF
jgi:hypothetical protein